MEILFWIGIGFMVLGLIGLIVEVKNAPEVDYGEDEHDIEELKKHTKNFK